MALTLLRDVTPARGLLLCAVQCGAACFAAWIVDIMYPTPMRVSASLTSGTSPVQGLFIETICTGMLTFTIIMLAKEKHRATFIAPIGIGLAMFIGELASVNFTGGALNPARWLGPKRHARDVEYLQLGPRWLALRLPRGLHAIKCRETGRERSRSPPHQCRRLALPPAAARLRSFRRGYQQSLGR